MPEFQAIYYVSVKNLEGKISHRFYVAAINKAEARGKVNAWLDSRQIGRSEIKISQTDEKDILA